MAKTKPGKSKKEIHSTYRVANRAGINKAAALARHLKAQPGDEQAAKAVGKAYKDKVAPSKGLYNTMTTAARVDANKPNYRGPVTIQKALQVAFSDKVHRMHLPKVKRDANTRKAGKLGSLPGADEIVAFFKGT